MTLSVLGAGAFGMALSCVLGRAGRPVMLWARDPSLVASIAETRRNDTHLPGADLPECVSVTAELGEAAAARTVLLAVPMQSLSNLLTRCPPFGADQALVACCKGIDLATLDGPTGVVARHTPGVPAILSGPGFAADLARGLPTAMTLACRDGNRGSALQGLLSTATLRLYRTEDTLGVELGGALKNVVAIAAGAVIGAGLGDSARAALVTRGFAEMRRLAQHLGARSETLGGLSGLGDLILTATSPQSRNFRHGLALGEGRQPKAGETVEGVATARAVTVLAKREGIDMPVAATVAALVDRHAPIGQVVAALMSRPLTEE